jgi:hypothetical protein
MVEREQGVVRNAILVGVLELKLDVTSAHAEIRAGVSQMARLGLDTKAFQTDVRSSLDGIDTGLHVREANVRDASVVAERLGGCLQDVLANTKHTDTYLRSKILAPHPVLQDPADQRRSTDMFSQVKKLLKNAKTS